MSPRRRTFAEAIASDLRRLLPRNPTIHEAAASDLARLGRIFAGVPAIVSDAARAAAEVEAATVRLLAVTPPDRIGAVTDEVTRRRDTLGWSRADAVASVYADVVSGRCP